MINRRDRFELAAGERFVLHKLKGGPKSVCIAGDGTLYTGEHRSRSRDHYVDDNAVLEALDEVSIDGGTTRFRARFVKGRDAGTPIVVHTNHAWPFCAYVAATTNEAESEARRQALVLEGNAGSASMGPPLRTYDESASKRPTNVSVNSDLLEKAKKLGINLSQALEGRLAELVRARLREQWLEENADAIDTYNRRIEQSGVFGDDVRKF